MANSPHLPVGAHTPSARLTKESKHGGSEKTSLFDVKDVAIGKTGVRVCLTAEP
jgi:hypothetical protein